MTHGCDGQTPDAGPPGVDTGARDTQPTKPTSRADGPVASWIERVRGEYREMPGLSLTVRQAARLWGSNRPPVAPCSTSFRPADSFALLTVVDTSAPTERNHAAHPQAPVRA
jgi:hypothetical protein